MITKSSGAASFDLALDGSLVYMAGQALDLSRTMSFVNRRGQEERVVAAPGMYTSARLSPDGTRAAVAVYTPDNADVWVYNFGAETETVTRLTDDAGSDASPIWTPDGLQIIWEAARGGGVPNLFRRAADGTGQEERLATSPYRQRAHDVSVDGTRLIFTENRPASGVDVGMLSLDGESHEIDWLLDAPYNERNPALSPDGRWLAYASDQSGTVEVFVRPFPNVEDGLIPISQGGGNWPAWAPDGDELFYKSAEGMWAARVETEPNFLVRARDLLFEDTLSRRAGSERTYDVAPDGQRFLMRTGEPAQPIFFQNWTQELKRLVPVP